MMKHTILGGLLFWATLILSTTFGVVFMLVPCSPLMFLSPKLFRKLADLMMTFYMVFVVAMIETIYGMKVIVTGDKIDSSALKNNLIIMNHRTRLDWLFFWSCLYRQSYQSLFKQRISLKHPLKFLPGLGWATQFAGYIFMKRNLETDKLKISDMLSYYHRVHKHVDIVLFPEGRDLDTHTIADSNKYCVANNLPKYIYVLHPRTRGFAAIVELMGRAGDFDSLYDVTVAYRHSAPQDEMAILKGNFPKEIHFNIKRHKQESLPTEQEDLQNLCSSLWKAKEQQLEQFYAEGSFDRTNFTDHPDSLGTLCQVFALIYWVPYTLYCAYAILTNGIVLSYFIVVCVCLASAEPLFGGIDTLLTKI